MKEIILSAVVCVIGLALLCFLLVWNRNDLMEAREKEKQEWLKEAREACPCQ